MVLIVVSICVDLFVFTSTSSVCVDLSLYVGCINLLLANLIATDSTCCFAVS